MRGSRIQIEDEVFDTLKDAAAFLGLNDYDLSGKLDDCEEKVIKGFKVKRLNPRASRLCGAIYCNKNGKLYKNAVVLGKRLKVNPAYISNELRKNNKYVDIYNNTYRRVLNPDNFDMSKAIDTVEPVMVSIKELPTPEPKQEEVAVTQPTVTTPVEVNLSTNELDALNKVVVSLLDKKDYATCETLLKVMKDLNKKAVDNL